MDLDQLVPLKSKILRITDVSERLAFPVRLIGHIWGPGDQAPKKNFRVLDRFDREWELQAHMRLDKDGHQKPEVYGPAWKDFVNHNQLRVGDELVFYRHPNPNPRHVAFVVGAKREVTIMGQSVSGHITPPSMIYNI